MPVTMRDRIYPESALRVPGRPYGLAIPLPIFSLSPSLLVLAGQAEGQDEVCPLPSRKGIATQVSLKEADLPLE
jgi:hypothetical protein